MKVILYIRRAKDQPSRFTMRTDFQRERDDTPRISNLGIEIKEHIDGIIRNCEADGVVAVSPL